MKKNSVIEFRDVNTKCNTSDREVADFKQRHSPKVLSVPREQNGDSVKFKTWS